MRNFVDEVYLPDTLAIASFYKDWFERGEGLGNFMTYGDFPPTAAPIRRASCAARARSSAATFRTFEPVDLDAGAESRSSSPIPGTTITAARSRACTPIEARRRSTIPGPKPPYDHSTSTSYSWLKSPRWKGQGGGSRPARARADAVRQRPRADQRLADKALAQLDLPLEAMFSTIGRTAARTLESKIIADAMQRLARRAHGQHQGRRRRHLQRRGWEPSSWPRDAQGRRLHRGPARRARPLDRHPRRQDRQLSGRRAEHLECRPARRAGPEGAYEAALKGHVCTIRSSRSRSCARSIVSIPASPARSCDRPQRRRTDANRGGVRARFALRAAIARPEADPV